MFKNRQAIFVTTLYTALFYALTDFKKIIKVTYSLIVRVIVFQDVKVYKGIPQFLKIEQIQNLPLFLRMKTDSILENS
jgi:hypothetical protein